MYFYFYSQMVLANHKGVFWMDSSIYFLSSDMTSVQRQISMTGVTLLYPTKHSNFAVTHRNMFSFFPTEARVALFIQHQANVAVFYRTARVVRDVIRWYVYCSLDERCIAPTRQLTCDFREPIRIYANCHRFDQSALNLILANQLSYCNISYFISGGNLLTRWPKLNLKTV